MAAGYWLKLYTEILDNPEYSRLSDAGKLGIYELLIVAKRVDLEGSLPVIEDIAFYTRRDAAWWTPVIQELKKIEFLIIDDSGTLLIRNFSTRQAPVDDAERKRQERSKKHRLEFEDTSGHEPVTELSRNVMENRHREAEAETETDADADVPPNGGGNANFSDLFSTFTDLVSLPPPESKPERQRWDTAFQDMVKAGITSPILSQAIHELQAKKFIIAGPQSVITPAVICLGKARDSTRRRDSEGKFADFVNH